MIPDVFQKTNARFDMIPYEINNGCCVDWAEMVYDSLKHTKHRVEIWETIREYANCSHVFIRVGEKFYDAECHEGVDDHMNLPLFEKAFAETSQREPVWLLEYNYNIGDDGKIYA